jgi:hypothetical protein
MKKIKNIGQLNAEKKHNKQHQLELEDKIRNNWHDLKEQLRPSNVVKETFSGMIDRKKEATQKNGNVFKSTLSYGLSLLAEKLADKANSKLNRLFKKS